MGFRVSAPAPDLGYNRTTDWPTGNGAGPGKGGLMASMKSTISPNGATTGASAWHPTVLWMLGFVAAELVAFHLLSRSLNI